MQIDLKVPGALTPDSVADLLASVTDKTPTQLRVTKQGIAFISTTDVGGDNTKDLAFRLETWSQDSDYVGPAAARDADWVKRIYNVLKHNWPSPSSEYIDIF